MKYKEIDRLANEIANVLSINSDSVNLSRVGNGWFADAENIKGDVLEDPIRAMEDLLNKVSILNSN